MPPATDAMNTDRAIRLLGAAVLALAGIGAAQAQEPLISRVTQSGWLRCGIIGGRLTADGSRMGTMRSATKGPQREESLTTVNDNDQFSLSYQRTTKDEQLAIEIAGASGRFLLRRTPRGDSTFPATGFKQSGNEKIEFTVGTGPKQQKFLARDIWQLLLAEPKLCREHLLPLLDLLRPNWKLGDIAGAVEERLLREAGAHGGSNRERWSTMVAQLGDDSFAKREAADRALRNGNGGALAYLRQLDFTRLDAEQQSRVRRIIEVLTAQNNDDTIDQVAASLAADPAIWLALLARPQLKTRQIAARELAALLGDSIPVDPAADPASQKDQRERLRARIEGK
jgi:hypothetical protein